MARLPTLDRKHHVLQVDNNLGTSGWQVMAAVSRGVDRSSVTWPATLGRWGVTPLVIGLWVAHEALVALGPLVPFAMGPNAAFFGVPWYHFDVGWYLSIARYGYLPAHEQMAAYFPGVPAYLWLAHSRLIALIGLQLLLLLLLVQAGRLATAWGLSGRRVVLVQALVALPPAAVFYSTAYPEIWLAVGLCGALLAMRASKPWEAAAWSTLAGVVDPLGLVVGLGAATWVMSGMARRNWPAVRAGVTWGLGSVGGLVIVMGVLEANLGHPLEFIRAQQAWGARWTVPGVQVVQALTEARAAPATLAALGVLPIVAMGLVGLVQRARWSAWYLACAVVGATFLVLPLAFYSNRTPLSSTALFLSVDVPAAIGLSALASRRLAWGPLIWYGGWSAVGAVLFTHGWFWG